MREAVAGLLWNPIVEKELRSRMRTWRTPLAITVFLAFTAAVGWLALLSAVAVGSLTGSSNINGVAGAGIFSALTYCVLILILFVSPALTAGAISGERDRQTLDLLLITRVRPASIVSGKLIASLAFVLLLILLSVPVYSFAFLFGGIDLGQIVAVVMVGLVTALLLGSFGILASVLARGSIGATVGTYVAGFAFLVLPLVAPSIGEVLSGPGANFSRPGAPAYQLADPLLAVAASIGGTGFSLGRASGCHTDVSGTTTCFDYGRTTGVSIGASVGGGVFTGPLRRGNVMIPAPVPPPFPYPNGNQQAQRYELSADRVVTNGDQIIGGPFRGFSVWQAFTILDGLLALIVLALATLLLSRRGLGRRG